MTDYISKEALLQTLDDVIARTEETYPITPDLVYELRGEINATKAIWVLVNRFDAADVEPVVRCKDCKHYKSWHDGVVQCTRFRIYTAEDDFCSSGAKMDGGADNASELGK